MQKKILLIAIVVGIIIGTIASFGWNAYRSQNLSDTAGTQVVEAVTLEIFSDPVYIVPPGKQEPQQVENRATLEEGTTIRTGSGGRAQIVYPNGTVTRLDQQSDVTLTQVSIAPVKIKVKVNNGHIWSRVAKLSATESYETESGKVMTKVHGTSFGHYVLNDATDKVVTTRGEVVGSCLNKGQEQVITRDNKVVFNCDKTALSAEPISEVDMNDEWFQFNVEEDAYLNDRFGPYVYNDDTLKDKVLGLADKIIDSDTGQRVRSLVRNVFNPTQNTTTQTGQTLAEQTSGPTATPVPQIPRSIITQIPKPTATRAPVSPTLSPVPTIISKPNSIATIEMIESKDGGKVEINDGNTFEILETNKQIQVNSNAKIKTIGSARAEIKYNNGSVTRLDYDTSVNVDYKSNTSFNVSIYLDAGRIWSRIKKLTGSEDSECGLGKECYNSITNTMTATVRGTSYGHEVKKEKDSSGMETMVDHIYTIEGKVIGQCNTYIQNDVSRDQSQRAQEVDKNFKAKFKCLVDSATPELTSMTTVPESDSEWIYLNSIRDKELEEKNNDIRYYDPGDAPQPNSPPTASINSCYIHKFRSVKKLNNEQKEITELVPITKDPVPCVTAQTRKEGENIELEIQNGDKIVTIRNEEDVISTLILGPTVVDDNLPFGRNLHESWQQINGPDYCYGQTCSVLVGKNKFFFFARTNAQTEENMYQLRFVVEEQIGKNTNAFATDDIFVRVIDDNAPPLVNAGNDKTIKLKPNGLDIRLNGIIEDDGKTSEWHNLSYKWELQEGAVTGISINENEFKSKNPLIKFNQPGEYVFKLKAFDGEYEAEDTVTITAIMPENQPPEVKVGPDRMVKLKGGGETVNIPLRGRATDDNYPNEELEYEWTVKLDGNGERSVGPDNDSEQDQPQCYSLESSKDPKSSISFSCDGTYTITLTAFDGMDYSSDSLVVKVVTEGEVSELKPVAELELDEAEQNATIKVSNIYDYDYLTYELKYTCTENCDKETEDERQSSVDKSKRVEKGVKSNTKIEIPDDVFERKIVLGTCSTTCIYDKDIDDISLEVRLYKENDEEPKVLNFLYEPVIDLPVEILTKVGDSVELKPTIKYLRQWQKNSGQQVLIWLVTKGDENHPEMLHRQSSENIEYTFLEPGTYRMILLLYFQSELEKNTNTIPLSRAVTVKVEESESEEPKIDESGNDQTEETTASDTNTGQNDSLENLENEEHEQQLLGTDSIEFTVNKVIANMIVERMAGMSYTNNY